MLTRRTALTAALAAGACTTTGQSGAPADEQFRNIETPSESVHSGVASDDGEKRLTVRLCRYPELGLAWIWIHARTPEGFFSYVDHMAPCGRDASVTDADAVQYADAAETIVFERVGRVNSPLSAAVRGTCMARKSATSAFGKGSHRLEFSIRFFPQRLYSGLNRGRTEIFGHTQAVVTIDGKRTEIDGVAQFHEQGQTNPRFTAPFCYMSLWGRGAASTLLIAPRRREGYLLEGDKATEVKNVVIDPPAQTRKLAVALADGRVLEGETSVVQAYTLPLVGNTWRGHMSNVRLGEHMFRGQVNDYAIGDGIPYAG